MNNNYKCFEPTMNHKYVQFLIYENAFSNQECDDIISLFTELEQAKISNEIVNNKIRNNKIKFLNREQSVEWIFKKLNDYVFDANSLYKFDISCYAEGLQLSQYNEGDFYGWHKDFNGGDLSNRKISTSLILNDNFNGGELCFFGPNGELPLKVNKGSLVVFPSFELHKVNVVKEGTRFSLVSWVHGNTFR
jgi:PKHD-type hydroxylase